MPMMSAIFRAVALAAAVVFSAGAASAETAGAIAVENAWSREVPAGASVGVGYLAITNSGDEPDRLVSASTSVAGETMIHQTTMADGVMKMRPVPDGVALPAKGTAMPGPNPYPSLFTG